MLYSSARGPHLSGHLHGLRKCGNGRPAAAYQTCCRTASALAALRQHNAFPEAAQTLLLRRSRSLGPPPGMWESLYL